MEPITATLYNLFIVSLDKTLAFVSITLLLSFYGTDLVRPLIKKFKGPSIYRFIIFIFIAMFGINLLLVFLVNAIISIAGITKWILISLLVLWNFFKFNKEINS
jgi:hypothetical protein